MKNKILILIAALVLVSCKTTRTVTKSVEVSVVGQLEQVIENVKKTQPTFNTANINKMSIELNLGERQVNVSASCKIKKDSLIHISIQPFMGIEMFKAEFSTDSIRVFDKMNRRYYVIGYAYLKKRLGIDVSFSSLQSLLFNQYFSIGETKNDAKSCTLNPLESKGYRIDCETANLIQNTDVSTTFNIQQIVLKGKEKPYQLKLNYDDYAQVNSIKFPQKISLNITNGSTTASSVFSILKVEFNAPIKFSTTSPDRYTRGDIEQLLQNNR